jgi:soluble lytic murein transglycosylase
MPATGKWFCGITKKELKYNAHKNTECGVRYFLYLKRMFGGSNTLALAAYHSGPTTVKDFRYGTNKSGRNPKHLKTGIPPWDVSYVRKVYRARAKYL